jgi:hypothetical protein
MRTISIQADYQLDQITEEWLALLVLVIPVGPEAGRLKFDRDLSDGTIVSQRHEGTWTVSFQSSPGGANSRHYASPYVVARVIITGQHDEAAALDGTECAGYQPALAVNGQVHEGR